MNTYLAEIMTAQRIADLRREADNARLVAAARRSSSAASAPHGDRARSSWHGLILLRRRTA